MFFDEVLVQNKVLRKVWRAGHDQISESDESLPKICETLDTWVDSDAMDARRRLSLRTSSILIDGAAKLYKKGIQQLLEDVAKLDEEMIQRNRRKSNSSEEDPDPASTTSGSYETPEQMMSRAEIHSDISFEVRPRESPLSPILGKSLSYTRNKVSCSTQSSKRQSNECMDSNGQSPKRRLYDSDQPRETDKTPYPSSLTSVSSDHQTSDSVSADQQTERQTESDKTVDDQIVKTTRNIERSILSTNNKKNSDRKSSNSGEAVERSSDTDKNTSKSSPTFTDIFDFVAHLPNNDHAIKIMTETHADDIRNNTDSETNSSASHVSQRSIILKSTKNAFPKLPRNKKGRKSMKKRKDQGTQTVSFHPRMSDREDTYDENLPFGCLMIYDTIHSRIPSKIVFSSLNAKVNNL